METAGLPGGAGKLIMEDLCFQYQNHGYALKDYMPSTNTTSQKATFVLHHLL